MFPEKVASKRVFWLLSTFLWCKYCPSCKSSKLKLNLIEARLPRSCRVRISLSDLFDFDFGGQVGGGAPRPGGGGGDRNKRRYSTKIYFRSFALWSSSMERICSRRGRRGASCTCTGAQSQKTRVPPSSSSVVFCPTQASTHPQGLPPLPSVCT